MGCGRHALSLIVLLALAVSPAICAGAEGRGVDDVISVAAEPEVMETTASLGEDATLPFEAFPLCGVDPPAPWADGAEGTEAQAARYEADITAANAAPEIDGDAATPGTDGPLGPAEGAEGGTCRSCAPRRSRWAQGIRLP